MLLLLLLSRKLVAIQRGAPNSADICQPFVPVLFRAPALTAIGDTANIQIPTRAKRFHRHYREQRHHSTGTIGSPPL